MRTLIRATATISSKGQLTLPKVVRERLGVDKGDEVEFTLDDQGIHLRPRRQGDNPFLVWLDQGPASTAFSSDLLGARHAGLDETERALLRAGPGARVVRLGDLDEDVSS
jgi:antitoxin PrlF